jgi:hypothetical protein
MRYRRIQQCIAPIRDMEQAGGASIASRLREALSDAERLP